MSTQEDIRPGDIVVVSSGPHGRKEGLVIGSHVDYAGRQVVQVQFEPGSTYDAWYPMVTRVRRTISYSHPSSPYRTIERHVYW